MNHGREGGILPPRIASGSWMNQDLQKRQGALLFAWSERRNGLEGAMKTASQTRWGRWSAWIDRVEDQIDLWLFPVALVGLFGMILAIPAAYGLGWSLYALNAVESFFAIVTLLPLYVMMLIGVLAEGTSAINRRRG